LKALFPFNSRPALPLRLYRRAICRPRACIPVYGFLSKATEASRATGTVMLVKPSWETENFGVHAKWHKHRIPACSQLKNERPSNSQAALSWTPDKLTRLVPELDCLAWCVFKANGFNYVLQSDVETTPPPTYPSPQSHSPVVVPQNPSLPRLSVVLHNSLSSFAHSPSLHIHRL
jgi:hypothetical protein